MNKLFISLVVGGLLTVIDTYPAYSRLLPTIGNKQVTDIVTNSVVRTTVRTTNSKKNLQVIKALEDALTLSRFKKGGEVHTLAVLNDNGESITGVDISLELNRYDLNSFDVIKNLAFDDVVNIVRSNPKKVTVKYTDLLPSVAGDEHLAIGINYAEHGKETGQVKPFMFPKFVKTDPVIHELNYTKGWLLDHEVELGIVFPSAVCSVEDLNRSMVGFLVVNDFTDRASLMRKMDSQNVTGGKGFPDAKSKKGFLPTGPYLVIPKDWHAFVQEIQLKLTVNGEVRQIGSAKDMVWNIKKIIEKSLSMKGENKSYYQGKMVKLFEGDCIPANCIIITGTPAGVVFNSPSKGFIIGRVTKYIFTGGFFSSKMHPYILKQYLKKELKNPRYLKPGDRIETSISYLGTINTEVKNSSIDSAK
jgi:2,4-diketo-3-deoxy-L-fuconate hydrolase